MKKTQQKLLSKSPALLGLRLEKDEKLEVNIIVRNVFRLKNKIDGNAIKNINLLDERKENEAINYRLIRDFRKLFDKKRRRLL